MAVAGDPGVPGGQLPEVDYELVSGNLLKTVYNEGRSDGFRHQYYGYYTMGSLARREIGKDSLQGLDHTYTLQGCLKAVNHVGDVCEAWYAGIGSDGDEMADRMYTRPNYSNGPVWLDGDGDSIPDDTLSETLFDDELDPFFLSGLDAYSLVL